MVSVLSVLSVLSVMSVGKLRTRDLNVRFSLPPYTDMSDDEVEERLDVAPETPERYPRSPRVRTMRRFVRSARRVLAVLTCGAAVEYATMPGEHEHSFGFDEM